jgi:hypothetical protein
MKVSKTIPANVELLLAGNEAALGKFDLNGMGNDQVQVYSDSVGFPIICLQSSNDYEPGGVVGVVRSEEGGVMSRRRERGENEKGSRPR